MGKPPKLVTPWCWRDTITQKPFTEVAPGFPSLVKPITGDFYINVNKRNDVSPIFELQLLPCKYYKSYLLRKNLKVKNKVQSLIVIDTTPLEAFLTIIVMNSK